MAGSVDMANVRPIDALALAEDPRFNIYHGYLSWWVQIALYWQHKSPLFKDADVRRALTMAIDRRELYRVTNVPDSTPVVDAPYSLQQLARKEFREPIPYDLEQAKALLERAGWRDGDGVREKEGGPFRFTVLASDQRRGMFVDMATYIREQLRKIEVDMDILTADSGVITQRVDRGEFDAVIFSFTLGLVPDMSRWMGYDDAELNDLTRKLLRSDYHSVPEQERALYARAYEIFQRDAPVTFLGPRFVTTVAHRRINGLSSPWQAGPGATFWRFPISAGPQP